jgi:hypothetical protein
MNPSFLYPVGETPKNQSDEQINADSQPAYSTNEGSEFLDDAIRMKEMPLMFSEQKIDTGGKRNLL